MYIPTVSPSTIPLVYYHINSFQQASSVERPLPGGAKRTAGRASHHEEWCSAWVVSPPVWTAGLSLIAVWGLIGATPRGQPWTPAVTLPQRRDGLSARRMAVLWTFREPSLRRHVHREFLRSALLDLIPIIPATACHKRNYVERYSRYKTLESNKSEGSNHVPQVLPKAWGRFCACALCAACWCLAPAAVRPSTTHSISPECLASRRVIYTVSPADTPK